MEQRHGTGHTLCTWCGEPVEPGEGYRLVELPGERHGAFCRLEHVVPWAIRGAHWEPGATGAPVGEAPDTCSQCGAPLDDIRLVLVHERGDEPIPDAFCSVDHLRSWAAAGGRYR